MSSNQPNSLDYEGDIMSWLPQIYGTDVGNGNGLKFTELQLRKTGQAFTGYEILESIATKVAPVPFKVVALLRELSWEVDAGSLIVLEHPTPNNEMGRFYFNPQHSRNISAVQILSSKDHQINSLSRGQWVTRGMSAFGNNGQDK